MICSYVFVHLCPCFSSTRSVTGLCIISYRTVSLQVKVQVQPKKTAKPVKQDSSDDSSDDSSSDEVERHQLYSMFFFQSMDANYLLFLLIKEPAKKPASKPVVPAASNLSKKGRQESSSSGSEDESESDEDEVTISPFRFVLLHLLVSF